MAVASQFDAIHVTSPPAAYPEAIGEYLNQMRDDQSCNDERQEVPDFEDESMASSQQRSEVDLAGGTADPTRKK